MLEKLHKKYDAGQHDGQVAETRRHIDLGLDAGSRVLARDTKPLGTPSLSMRGAPSVPIISCRFKDKQDRWLNEEEALRHDVDLGVCHSPKQSRSCSASSRCGHREI